MCTAPGVGISLYTDPGNRFLRKSDITMAFPRTPNSAAKPGVNPWLVAVVVSMATFMEVLDTSIANVSLAHIAGNLGASQNEATWVLTSYLAANAIVIPISGWLSSTLGRKRFYMICVALFTVSSFLCGMAPSPGHAAAVPGAPGRRRRRPGAQRAGMLADTFPGQVLRHGLRHLRHGGGGGAGDRPHPGRLDHRQLFLALDLLHERPGGAAVAGRLPSRLIQDPARPRSRHQRNGRARIRVDHMGFAFVVLAFGCLQVVLDKGQEDDWFGSTFICRLRGPDGDRLRRPGGLGDDGGRRIRSSTSRSWPTRNLATSMVLQFVVGFILNSTTVLIPLFAQQLLGYNATQAGLLLMPGGLVLMVMMPDRRPVGAARAAQVPDGRRTGDSDRVAVLPFRLRNAGLLRASGMGAGASSVSGCRCSSSR